MKTIDEREMQKTTKENQTKVERRNDFVMHLSKVFSS